ncbi:MAG: NAD(P) transhydrogenase subunit alpha [Erysipelotrichales bacterium]
MGSILLLVILLLSTIIGYKMISNVPSLLHTPLMSSMNALSGITVLGALTITAIATQLAIFGYIAIILAMINVCGGFFVSDRMLRMFKSKGD